MQIDINCDMGESYGRFKVGNDENIFPYITSCNIACGFHGGDPFHIEKTIKDALDHGVQIGAHPSYPDLAGFGRRKMQLDRDELKALIKYQIAALKGMTESLGGKLIYVKPHGALYNTAANDESETVTIIQAIQEIDSDLALMGLAGSIMEKCSKEKGILFIAEAFADRTYEADGKLMSRSKRGAVLNDPEMAAKQVRSIVMEKNVKSGSGNFVPIHAQSVCIHGDNPTAVEILKTIRKELRPTWHSFKKMDANMIEMKPYGGQRITYQF